MVVVVFRIRFRSPFLAMLLDRDESFVSLSFGDSDWEDHVDDLLQDAAATAGFETPFRDCDMIQTK